MIAHIFDKLFKFFIVLVAFLVTSDIILTNFKLALISAFIMKKIIVQVLEKKFNKHGKYSMIYNF